MSSGVPRSSDRESKFAIVVPTHDRHGYFDRLFAYYRGWECRVILVDSTAEPFAGDVPDNFTYLHASGKRFAEKVVHAARLCDEPYVALCADDDVLLPEGLESCVTELEIGSCGVCGGTMGKFHPEEYGKTFFASSVRPLRRHYPNGTGEPRFLGDYSLQILWSVYERELLVEIFTLIVEIRLKNDNYMEIIVGILGQYRRGITLTATPFILREISSSLSWGHGVVPIHAEVDPRALDERARVMAAIASAVPSVRAEADLALYLRRQGNQLLHGLKFRLYCLLSRLRVLRWHSRREVRGLTRKNWPG